MGKKNTDYSKSCVYRLIYNHTTYYVGSTTNMRQRKSKHKYNSYNEKSEHYNVSIYEFIRANGVWSDWSMILVQQYPDCKSGDELRMYERHHYELFTHSLNSIKPFVTVEEAKERDKLNGKKYYDNNKEVLLEKNKVYKDNNKEVLSGKRQENYIKNKDKVRENYKLYYFNHKDEIAEKGKIRSTCDCGSVHRTGDKARHLKSLKHKKFLEEQNNTTVV